MNSPVENNLKLHAPMGTWEASLALEFQATARGTVLSRNERVGPLYVQKPFYPEGREVLHMLLLHPPGGLVSGDTLNLKMNLEEKSHVVLTTPGAGRMYRMRADGLVQKQYNDISLAPEAEMEWLPLETIVYPKAKAKTRTQFSLSKSSKLIAWEVCSIGLPASHLGLEEGELDQTFSVWVDGRLRVKERLLIDNQTRELIDSCVGYQSQPVVGLAVFGPWGGTCELQEDDWDTLRSFCEALTPEHTATVTELGGFVVARYLGPCSEKARKLFTQLWTLLRPKLLNKPACAPRIWRT